VKVLGPTLRREGRGAKLVCCDSFGWHQAATYSAAIEADPLADRYVAIQSGHTYASPADTPLPTDDPTWMTEWGPGGNTWDEAWDDGLPSAGIAVAQQIDQAFAQGNVSAYIYWVAASLGATRAFIQIPDSGDGYRVSKRLWAFAAYSRFIRPGAVRVPAQAADPNVNITAFRNADGSMVVELLNTGTADVSTAFTTDMPVHRVSTYLTNEAHSVDLMSDVRTRGGHSLPVQLPARSLTTLVLSKAPMRR
jgi:O-glycosyl hydrolase